MTTYRRTLSGRTVAVEEPVPGTITGLARQLLIRLGLKRERAQRQSRSAPPVYGGVSYKTKAKRRARGKVAKASRKINRGTR